MTIRLLTESADDRALYNAWVNTHPQGNLWQSLEWATYQHALGRKVQIYIAEENEKIIASALIVIDRTSFGLSTWDCPRGPIGTVEKLLQSIESDAKKDKCLCLYLSPAEPLLTTHYKLLTSSRHEQPEATIILDLMESDEQLLTHMHPKGRYNIKVAGRSGVTIEQSTNPDDAETFHTLLLQTAGRDGFAIKPKAHYRAFLKDLPGSFLLFAKKDGAVIGGLMGVMWNRTGIYYYGASSYEHRQLMAPYLLQWEAMKMCREKGCTKYDLLGISPESAAGNHPWAGVTEFKRKFGGTVMTYPQEQQIALKPIAMSLLSIKRKILG